MKPIALLTICSMLLLSCSKDSGNSSGSNKVKYEVLGSSTEGYDVSYIDGSGQTQWTKVNSGWTYEVNAKQGVCYILTIIPHSDCNSSGTLNIYINNSLRASKIVGSFQGTSVTNSSGGTSCGTLTEACN
jgi:hypothetical protein